MSDLLWTRCPSCHNRHFVWGGFWRGLFRLVLQVPIAIGVLLLGGWATKMIVTFLLARLP